MRFYVDDVTVFFPAFALCGNRIASLPVGFRSPYNRASNMQACQAFLLDMSSLPTAPPGTVRGEFSRPFKVDYHLRRNFNFRHALDYEGKTSTSTVNLNLDIQVTYSCEISIKANSDMRYLTQYA